jgi:hypothetical protein
VAHAGLATTDVAFVAGFLLALLALRGYLTHPSMRSAALLGAAAGVALGTKFSALVFLPPAAAAIVVCHLSDRRDQGRDANVAIWSKGLLATALAVGVLVLWGCYGFRVGRMADLPAQLGSYGTMPATGWLAAAQNWRLPAHELFHGLVYLTAHTAAGHAVTLFDQFSQRGFLLFYPVVLATKTPLPFLLFVAIGVIGLVRTGSDSRWSWHVGYGLAALALLLVALTSPINLGVRHVLAIYPLVAAASAFGLVRWAEQRHGARLLAIGIACLAWQVGVLVAAVPNQLAYFNVLAGREPAYVSSDSDFDWGQDALALERYFETHEVPSLYLQLNGSVDVCALSLPPVQPLPTHPVSGWIAVSERIVRMNRGTIHSDFCAPRYVVAPQGWLDWLEPHTPVAIIGRTVRLYHIPGGANERDE